MTAEENKAMSRRGVEEVWNEGNLSVIDEVFAPDIVIHDLGSPGGEMRGRESTKQYRTMFRTAFPDLRLTIDDMIAEGDRVMVRITARGTHQGMLHGIPPTGKRIIVTGIGIDRYANGKLVEGWSSFDTLGLLQQIGVLPPQPRVVAKILMHLIKRIASRPWTPQEPSTAQR